LSFSVREEISYLSDERVNIVPATIEESHSQGLVIDTDSEVTVLDQLMDG
jgi:hypothetical protein